MELQIRRHYMPLGNLWFRARFPAPTHAPLRLPFPVRVVVPSLSLRLRARVSRAARRPLAFLPLPFSLSPLILSFNPASSTPTFSSPSFLFHYRGIPIPFALSCSISSRRSPSPRAFLFPISSFLVHSNSLHSFSSCSFFPFFSAYHLHFFSFRFFFSVLVRRRFSHRHSPVIFFSSFLCRPQLTDLSFISSSLSSRSIVPHSSTIILDRRSRINRSQICGVSLTREREERTGRSPDLSSSFPTRINGPLSWFRCPSARGEFQESQAGRIREYVFRSRWAFEFALNSVRNQESFHNRTSSCRITSCSAYPTAVLPQRIEKEA